jgi:molecular chaperone DnaK
MDLGTQKKQNIRIEASSGLTEQEIQRMRDEARANEAADKAEKEKIEKINAADSMIFQTEKQLKEYGGKLSAGNKSAIEAALADLRNAHAQKDVAAIDRAMEALNGAWNAASQEIYQAAAGSAANNGTTSANGAAGSSNNSDVTDVDYEEVKK